MRRRTGAGRVAALALLCTVVGLPSVADSAAPAPVRILIVGDSVAQGSAGDWTWRYRLWQTLRSSGVSFDLVGPSNDLFDARTNEPGSLAYADPAFDRDHAARWGMKLAKPDESMTSLMNRFQPDVVIETRGVNDIAWNGARADDVDGMVTEEVAEARAVDPDVDFVVAELPQQWIAGVAAYNASLQGLTAELSQAGSSVVTAETGHGFQELVDTWDPAHLTATGEVKMASGVADALAVLGVGDGAGVPPRVTNGHWGNATLAVVPGDGKATLRWHAPPGAREEFVWSRDLTSCTDWARLPVPLEGISWEARGLIPGHRYEFRLQAAKGAAVNAGYSNVVGVVTRGADPWPQQSCTPKKVVATPGLHRLSVRWTPVPTATSYVVTWTGRKRGLRGRATVTSPAIAIRHVLAGERYDVRVTARNAGGPGPAATVVGVPRGPKPPAPTRLLAEQVAADRARLTWRRQPVATSYEVQVLRRGRWAPVRTVRASSMVVGRLPHGMASFRVRSWHQLVPGPWSGAVRVRMR